MTGLSQCQKRARVPAAAGTSVVRGYRGSSSPGYTFILLFCLMKFFGCVGAFIVDVSVAGARGVCGQKRFKFSACRRGALSAYVTGEEEAPARAVADVFHAGNRICVKPQKSLI